MSIADTIVTFTDDARCHIALQPLQIHSTKEWLLTVFKGIRTVYYNSKAVVAVFLQLKKLSRI